MTLLHSLLLGCVEGVTEFLPVSSTAHLLLTQTLLGLPLTENLKSFDIAIQLGAILAVVLLSGKRLVTDRKMILLVLTAFVPTALIGFLLHDFVRGALFESTKGILLALMIGGIVLIVVEQWKRRSVSDRITGKQAFLIGVLQTVSMMPGVSRSGATIVAALLLGISRKEAVEFSFLIAIPTMAAATGLDLLKNPGVLSAGNLPTLGVGFVAAFVTAFFVIKWLRAFIETHTFVPFGIYRILIGFGLMWLLV